MAPQRPDFILTTHIPDIEFDVLVGHALDVEADGWNRGYVLIEFQFIQNGCQRGKSAFPFFPRGLCPCLSFAAGKLPTQQAPSLLNRSLSKAVLTGLSGGV